MATSTLPSASSQPPTPSLHEHGAPHRNQSGGARTFHNSSRLPSSTPHSRCSGEGGGVILRTVPPLSPGRHRHIRKLGRRKESRASLPPRAPPRGERTGTLPAATTSAAYAPSRRRSTYSAAAETTAAAAPSRAGAVPRRRGVARAAPGGVSVHGAGRQKRHPLEVAAALASALLAPAVAAHTRVSAPVVAPAPAAAVEVT